MLSAEKLAPPDHLSDESRRQWAKIIDDGIATIDAAAYPMFVLLFEARDGREEARLKIIETGGAVIKDRFGQLKMNAWAARERDCAIVMDRAFKSLGFTQAPPDGSQGSLF